MRYLAQITFPEVERLGRDGHVLVILPVGVVEEHGAHLPLGLDSFAAEVYADAAAPHLEGAGYDVVVAPTVSYGVAHQALDFPGTLTLRTETLRAFVADIGRSLAQHGLNRLVILNGHRDLSHMKALDEARDELTEAKIRVLCVGFTTDAAVTASCYREGVHELSRSLRPDREGHGGEWETSLALYSVPEMVERGIIEKLEPNFDYDVDAFRNETKDYRSLSAGRGYFGSPQSGSAETGRRIVAIRGRNIARVILQAWGPEERSVRERKMPNE
ncbi:MAG TPA: creatininase family protein [Candidatus Acidoferrales bacterium]|nr:creatininase family protein [Candidatus Acidoferrales bacterium]